MIVTLVTVIHIFICVVLVLIVLLQQGRGADMGATFGGGSNTLFGASGADNLLTKVTTITAGLFMCTSVFLASHAKHAGLSDSSVLTDLPSASTETSGAAGAGKLPTTETDSATTPKTEEPSAATNTEPAKANADSAPVVANDKPVDGTSPSP